MYEIDIYNNGVKTVIHYPDPNAPKLIQPHINKKRGQAGSLTFSIYPNNEGFYKLIRYATLVVCIDVRDNKEIFNGRVYTIKKSMDDKGLLKHDIVCEGEMNYMHDSNVGSVIYEDKTAQQMLQIFLDIHNGQVEDYKKVYLGNVTVTDWIFCTTSMENTLDAINTYVYKPELGYLQLRKVNGIKYLDYLDTTQDKIINAELGENLVDLIQTDDSDFGTRIIPVGANDLTIENVNGGLNYLEDSAAVTKYGIILKTVKFADIDDDAELKSQCQTQLSLYTTPKQSLEINVLDLATLAKTSENMIDETVSVHVTNKIMNIDEVWKVVEYDADLNEVYKPKVTLSNKATTLTGVLSSLVGSMVRNDDNYNGVQIGDSFGIRVKKDDIITLLNALEGISISKGGNKLFFVGTDGKLCAIQLKTNDTKSYMTLEKQWIDIYNNDTNIASFGYMGINNNGTLLPILKLGSVFIYEDPNEKGTLQIGNDVSCGNIYMNGINLVATQKWVSENYTSSQNLNDAVVNIQKWVNALLANYVSKNGNTVNLPNGMYMVCSGDQIDFYSSDGTKILGANKTSIAGHVPAGGSYTSVQS